MTKKVLVVGGAGYVGSHTAVALVEAGYEPIILDNFSNSHEQIYADLGELLGRQLPLYKLDACDFDAVATIFRKHAPFYGLIHFAALKSVTDSLSDPLAYYRNNLSSLWTVLQADPPNVVFSSSCTVYGAARALPVEENSPLGATTSPYGYTKQVCEKILEDNCLSNRIMRGVSLRYFNPIGAHPSAKIGEWPVGPPSNLVPALTQAVHKKEILTIYGTDYDTPDGSCIRDYIHVMDLAEAHVCALNWLNTQPKGTYEVFNCATGRGSSVQEVISTFEKSCNTQVKTKIGPRRSGDIPSIYANGAKIKRLLSWECTRSLSTALKDAWRWQQKLPK